MEVIRGRTSLTLDWNGLKERLERYHHAVLDLGTGDGRYVRFLAGSDPDRFVVGVDACRENLREHSRVKLPNMLFVIACARQLPGEFTGLFAQVTINFPWGSLLEDLLDGSPALMHGLRIVSRPAAQIEIRLNGGALVQAGTSLEAGTALIQQNLGRHGWALQSPRTLDGGALKNFPTSWAKRLAYGRDPRAVLLSGRRA